jgi:hypothetical protein
MKTILTALALAATLLSGAATANAVPIPKPDAMSYDRMPTTHQPVKLATTGTIDPYGTPADEGEAISPAELAELNATPDRCEEDEPCWDCATMGNKICSGTEVTHPNLQEDDLGWDCYLDGNRVCGPQQEGLEAEAWARFTPAVLPADIVAHGYKAAYMGTMPTSAPLLMDSWHAYYPSSKVGYYHVFSITL